MSTRSNRDNMANNQQGNDSGMSTEQIAQIVAQAVSAALNRIQSKTQPVVKPRSPTIPVPTFTADENQDVNQWLEEFEKASRLLNWDDEYKMSIIEVYLSGTASL